ncbi:MAG: hypothetical protein D6785_08385 [Planctomycetota bacterium]|nr:MAG: hypothetical protein D6785_08385 [Planctomycetota bacterium]
MAKGDSQKLNTRVIHKKVHHFFWLNIIPFGLVGVVIYLYHKGEITFHQFPTQTEKLLWLSVLSALLMITLTFLTYPFSVWLRRGAKRALKRTVPSITGEQGFFAFLIGIPLWGLRVLILFLSWCFYLAVIAMIGISALAFFAFLGYALYLNLLHTPSPPKGNMK